MTEETTKPTAAPIELKDLFMLLKAIEVAGSKNAFNEVSGL